MSAIDTNSSRRCAQRAPAALICLALAGAFLPLALAAQPRELAGNPFRGRQLFADKGCSSCHSVWGHGGSLGPDITVAVKGKTWFELVGDFWNHTPRMIDEVQDRGEEWPNLDPKEMADALAYLYYLRLFDDPGDADAGAEDFQRLRCAECHSLGGQGGRRGGSLDRFGAYPSPAPLAQAMWNAGPGMRRAQLRHGGEIPQFRGREMADLQAHIRAAGLREDRGATLLALPDPTRGQSVYRAKRCGACHARGGRGIPDLSRSALSKTVAEVTGMLWNHSYAMSELMRSSGVPFPRFADTELSDLISYLYFLGYAGEEGDPRRGAAVFEQKGCANCHGQPDTGAPELAQLAAGPDRAALASAMWNHAPQMYERMAEISPYWPKFEPGEMRDLAAFLQHQTGEEH